MTASFLIGTFLIIYGGVIRWQCYRALGRLFTFQLSIRKDHQLVTSGPYAVVRHPSYTSGFMCFIGAIFMDCTQGSWLRDSGVLNDVLVKSVFTFWGVFMTCFCALILPRLNEEDTLMKVQFGKQWDEWAGRVR